MKIGWDWVIIAGIACLLLMHFLLPKFLVQSFRSTEKDITFKQNVGGLLLLNYEFQSDLHSFVYEIDMSYISAAKDSTFVSSFSLWNTDLPTDLQIQKSSDCYNLRLNSCPDSCLIITSKNEFENWQTTVKAKDVVDLSMVCE